MDDCVISNILRYSAVTLVMMSIGDDVIMYRIAGKFRGRKLWRISRICAVPRKFIRECFVGVAHMEGGRGEARNTWQEFFGACVLKVLSIDRPLNMSLFKYFQTKSSLPKPDGPLSTVVPSSSIVAANKEVKQVLDKPEGKDTLTSKCGTYDSFTPEEKARIGLRSTV